MKSNQYLLKILSLASLLLSLTACIPGDKAPPKSELLPNGAVEENLAKTSTGLASLQSIQKFKNSGFQIQYQYVDESQIRAMNGHSGGGFARQGNVITIYINRALGLNEQAHVVVHEMSHVQDDFEVDEFEKNHPAMATAAQTFVSTKSYGTFDPRVSQYVLGTLFCTEVRAYTKNLKLAEEGTPNAYLVTSSQLASFVDAHYISQFNASYGTSAEQMKNWCLSQVWITDLLEQLAW